MIIRFNSNVLHKPEDKAKVAERIQLDGYRIIDKVNENFHFDQYKVAVFDKGGCSLSHTLEDGRIVALHTQLGVLFGEVFASKVRPIVCKSFSVFINHQLVHVVAKITMDRGVLSYACGDVRFNMDLINLSFEDKIFHQVLNVENSAIPRLSRQAVLDRIRSNSENAQ